LTIEFWVFVGRETYGCIEQALTTGAKGVDVVLTPTGGQILDLGVRVAGSPDRVEAYIDWFCDIIQICIDREVQK